MTGRIDLTKSMVNISMRMKSKRTWGGFLAKGITHNNANGEGLSFVVVRHVRNGI